MLEAISPIGLNERKRVVWLIRCDCGNEKPMQMRRFMGDGVKSCGCIKDDHKRGPKDYCATHRMSKHPAYHVWISMKDRCRLPTHKAWKNYGGRGIRVCEEWQNSFETFWEDMGPTYQTGLWIERKDNEGNYEKSNCMWATPSQQMRNTRRSTMIDTPFGRMTVVEAAEKSGINYNTLLARIYRGNSPQHWFDHPDTRNRFSIS